MEKNMKILSRIFTTLAIVATGFTACDCNHMGGDEDKAYNKVLILYSAGANSLSTNLKSDIEDAKKGYIPGEKDKDVFIIISQLSPSWMNFREIPPVNITRLYKNRTGSVVADTLWTLPAGSICTQKDIFRTTLETVKGNFEAREYGMVFSSHASGWVPAGYYYNYEESFFEAPDGANAAARRPLPDGAVPYYEPDEFPGLPRTKSIGQTVVQHSPNDLSYELDLTDFAAALPMKFEYILFDACLMGCVEAAYELKDYCKMVGFSAAEVMDKGFDYPTLVERLLKTQISRPELVCDDFYKYYEGQTGLYKSATIALVDCSKLEPLAKACKTIFNAHRSELAAINYKEVQPFFRTYHRWFFDLEDMVAHCNPTDDEKAAFDDAMNNCIIYKNATDTFFGGDKSGQGFDIRKFCGMTSYLPCCGNDDLSKYYKQLAWNKAVALVK